MDVLPDRFFYGKLNGCETQVRELNAALQDAEKSFNCLVDAYEYVKNGPVIPPLATTLYNQSILELNAMYQTIRKSLLSLYKRLELFEKAVRNDYHAHAMLLQDQGMGLDYVIRLGRSRISELRNRYKIEYNGIEQQIRDFNCRAIKLDNQIDPSTNPRKATIKRILSLKTLHNAIDKKSEDISSIYESITMELDQISHSLSRNISSLHSSLNQARAQIRVNPNDRYCECGVCTTNLARCPACGRQQF